MKRPTSQRLTNPFCVKCLPERRAAADALVTPQQKAEHLKRLDEAFKRGDVYL